MSKILPQQFYNQKTLKVAEELLGCFLIRKIGNKFVVSQIVETEAYNGPNDLASHASRGKTERNGIMFGSPGNIYVYFTYGMHYMLNIVTENEGYPAAILIRAIEPVINYFSNTNQSQIDKLSIQDYKCNGPAKLTKFLQINKFFNGLPIYTKNHGLWIEERKETLKSSQIKKTTRIGVDYAGEYKDKKWRFYIKENKFISKK